MKTIQERVAGSVAKFDYKRPDGLPWHRQGSPSILVLGKYVHPTTMMPHVAGVDLKAVYKEFGSKGLNALRKWLPELLGIKKVDPSKATDKKPETPGRHEIIKPHEMGRSEELDIEEDAIRTMEILLEYELSARPLKSFDNNTVGRWQMGANVIPDPIVNAIFKDKSKGAYRTYRMDRLGPITHDILTALEQDKIDQLKTAQDKIDQIVKSEPEEDEPVATPEEPLSSPPGEPSSEPDIAPKAYEEPDLGIPPPKKKRREAPAPLEEPDDMQTTQKKAPKEAEDGEVPETGNSNRVDREYLKNLAKKYVSKNIKIKEKMPPNETISSSQSISNQKAAEKEVPKSDMVDGQEIPPPTPKKLPEEESEK